MTEEPKHFAFYLASLQRGGAERVMSNLAVYLYERGHDITFVTTYFGFQEYDVPHAAWKEVPEKEALNEFDEVLPDITRVMKPDETVTYMDLNPVSEEGFEGRNGIRRIFSGLLPEQQSAARTANLAKRSKILHDVWEELQPDLILSFIGKNNVMALLTTVGMKIPVVVSVRINPPVEYASRQLHLSMISTYPRAAGVVIQLKSFENYFPPNIREKCHVLPNPIDPSFLREPFDGVRDKTIVSVGRLVREKNHALLLKAFARIKPTHPDYRLIIYGEGSELKRLQDLTHALGLRGSVEFAGQVNDIPDRIYDAGVFVLPSDEEGLPNALLEAMALGVPCIATDCNGGGSKELIKDGFNGLLTPMGDVSRLERAILRIIDNKGFADSLVEKALRVRETYNPDKVNAEWEEYLLSRLLPPDEVAKMDAAAREKAEKKAGIEEMMQKLNRIARDR